VLETEEEFFDASEEESGRESSDTSEEESGEANGHEGSSSEITDIGADPEEFSGERNNSTRGEVPAALPPDPATGSGGWRNREERAAHRNQVREAASESPATVTDREELPEIPPHASGSGCVADSVGQSVNSEHLLALRKKCAGKRPNRSRGGPVKFAGTLDFGRFSVATTELNETECTIRCKTQL
jgi:hypothetical protein